MRRVALLLALCATAASCGGKLQAKAKTPGSAATLTMPEPPGRFVMPVSVDPPPAPPAPDKPAATPTRPTGARPSPTPTPAATPTPTPSPPPDAGPPAVLQTSSASLLELETRARAQLEGAKKSLEKVKRASLGKDAQDQYDSAERYIKMAGDAITVKNFMLASFCADKASTLASLLIK